MLLLTVALLALVVSGWTANRGSSHVDNIGMTQRALAILVLLTVIGAVACW